MRKYKGDESIFGLIVLFFVSALIGAAIITAPITAQSGTYIDSSHGNSSYGVDRTSITGYAKGLCIHCHESHGSLNGEEPAPNSPAGPDKYQLFATNFDSGNALNNVCLNCHTKSTDSYQRGGTLGNRTYSFRAGGHSTTGFDNTALSIKDMLDPAFTNPPLSTHDMLKIGGVTGIINGIWNYTADSNPCVACHNPHKTKGDPANNPTSLKTNTSRGWPLSRPSQHKTTKDATYMSAPWQLWGDDASERMNAAYPGQYYDPLRLSGAYEPDGAATQQNGANLVNVVALCTDCHDNTNTTIQSTELGFLRTIDWAQEKHGAGNDGSPLLLRAPYLVGLANKVLSCTDCHEPHGAPNTTLIRGGVNGATLANPITLNPLTSGQCATPAAGNYSNKEMAYLCIRCHQDDAAADPTNCAAQTNRYYYIHHDAASGDAPYPSPGAGTCTTCHSGVNGAASCATVSVQPINCTCCHTHNSSAAGRRTF